MYQIYQVQNGDTLENISKKIGVSTQELLTLNGLRKEVSENQLLVIPNQKRLFDIYTVTKGDNMYELSKKFNVNLEQLLKINGLDKGDFIYPGQTIMIPRDDVSIYITKEETINDVASKLGVNAYDLLTQNETIYLLPDQLIVYRK